MTYDIKIKNDLSSGAMLVVSIPESDLDLKALYTLQADMPNFLVPFRFRSIDEQIEFTYIIGDRSILHYRFGKHTPAEYTDFWISVLQPLVDCTDWFLKADSFVLDTRYMYLNKDGKTISYIYIPSRNSCSETQALNQFVNELSQKNTVTDSDLENKVLRSIVHDFQLKSFLQMLRESKSDKVSHMQNGTSDVHSPAAANGIPPVREAPGGGYAKAEPPKPNVAVPTAGPSFATSGNPYNNTSGNPYNNQYTNQYTSQSNSPEPYGSAGQGDDGFTISLNDKRGKSSRGDNSVKNPQPPRRGFFGKKRGDNEIVLGAAAEPVQVQKQPKKGHDLINERPIMYQGDDSVTELPDDNYDSARLRLVSNAPFPETIQVPINPGSAFTIGRYDSSVGHQQSDFEFAHGTKAISRHHAAIERAQDGSYTIIDLSSKAGTFVNGERLVPNVPFRLERGSRVSFGNSGADYIWEA